ncbi:sensor histidine kinase [Piscinibacter sakaiensis]|uniref:Uncharacterized protein n=1 Tax=Piscinibacter sakaiensis TaxID=1547922 RepID=A0A0K8P617_PISS1|nr:histidine kinase [Piscinibacter sakaiensis]GAP37640.1 hypothetical protein ISF6_3585 [Piscinibacter sakaiensis]
MPTLPPVPHGDRSLWLGYAGLCLLCWLLYAMAGAEWLRGGWRAWQAAWEATWNLGPPILLGTAVLPWVRRLQARPRPLPRRLVAHALAATAFALAWHALDYGMAWALFGLEHADATLAQQALWRSAWAVFIYTALVLGFGGTLHARRAHAAALGIAQAEAARTRAELSAITGSLNPHFLFNTLNTLILLTRRDPAAAERGLLGFSRLLRQLLDTQRDASDRVTLRDEVDFVRDYLAIEALRLGERLRVDWRVEPDALDALLPPLTLQPLVENAVLHGIAPRIDGGTVTIEAARSAAGGLALRIADDGAGAEAPPALPDGRAARPPAGPRADGRRGPGLGLAALQRRFALDYGGRARLAIRTAPGAGFEVRLDLPPEDGPR